MRYGRRLVQDWHAVVYCHRSALVREIISSGNAFLIPSTIFLIPSHVQAEATPWCFIFNIHGWRQRMMLGLQAVYRVRGSRKTRSTAGDRCHDTDQRMKL